MPVRTRWSFISLVLVLVASVIGLTLWLGHISRSATAAPAPKAGAMAGMTMSEEQMRTDLVARYQAHPPHAAVATSAPVDSFIVSNFIFNEDGSLNTQIDTAHITAGQTIRFKWANGTHTVTSGTGPTDPNAGLLFDMPMASAGNSFNFTFSTPGTYPFFCQFHALSNNMKGVVEVASPTPTQTKSWGQVKKTYR